MVKTKKLGDLNKTITSKKRKKRLSIEEYINNRNADVDNILRKKQKISCCACMLE